ncbi:hypothetical protein [Actinoplanes solisilvae]|uniref:hypothetical protein n=1 Tax=Actinoplanes solisilvae TaxID=2486853 RepID=UPI000FDB114A|nr:hypothetical protein [Actinoplanes solisilvae]
MNSKFTGAVVVLASAAMLAAGCGAKDDANGAAPAAQATSAGPATNGVEALEGEQILQKAKAALKAAPSYHTKGKAAEDGSKYEFDLKAAKDDVLAEIVLDGAKVELLQVTGKRYFRADAKFWAMTTGGKAQGDAFAKVLGKRWVVVKPGDKSTEDMFAFADVEEILAPDGKVTKGTAKEVDGKPAIGLLDDGAEGGTMWIATTGEPYPLRIEAKDPAQGGSVFDQFGATFPELKAPAAADVIDIDKLKK